MAASVLAVLSPAKLGIVRLGVAVGGQAGRPDPPEAGRSADQPKVLCFVARPLAFARGRGPSTFLSYRLQPLECHAPVEAPVPETLRSREVGVRQSQLGPVVGGNEGELDLGDILRRFRLL
jgi:hypothetical protein